MLNSFYRRLPTAPFFSDFVLSVLTGSSFGALAVICSFVTFKSSSRLKLSASTLIVLIFVASAKLILMLVPTPFYATACIKIVTLH